MFAQTELRKELKELYYREYSSFTKDILDDYTKFKRVIKDEDKNLLDDVFLGTSKSLTSKVCNSFRTSFAEKVKNAIANSTTEVKEVIEILINESRESYLVGGSVRNAILGLKVKDYDFCTNISYDRMCELFSSNGFKVQEEGKEFLVMIISKNNQQFEIANLRNDGTYTDGRRPDSVSIGTIQEDAMRRDFTINSLYFRLHDSFLVDPTSHGIFDINNKVLRFVGKPKDRLKEDTLRAWRFFRFIEVLGFTADKKSAQAIKANFREIYEKTNPQRVLQELQKFINF